MKKILAIAEEVIMVSLRKHYLYIILIIGLFFILLSGCLYSSTMTINQKVLETGEVADIARTVSFHLVTFWGVLLTILFGARVYKEEYRSGHLEMVLSKPIPRWYYVVGRLLGSYIILLICVFSLGLITNIIYCVRLQTIDLNIWPGFGIISFEILLTLLFVSTLSLIIPRIIAIIVNLIAYLVSFIIGIEVVREAMTHPDISTKTRVIWKIIHIITPPLAGIQTLASKVISREVIEFFDYQALIQAGIYSVVLFLISIIIFNRLGK